MYTPHAASTGYMRIWGASVAPNLHHCFREFASDAAATMQDCNHKQAALQGSSSTQLACAAHLANDHVQGLVCTQTPGVSA